MNRRVWGIGGVCLLAASAAACAVGLFLEHFLNEQTFAALPHRPILQMVFACQAAFLLLFGPMAWAADAQGTQGTSDSGPVFWQMMRFLARGCLAVIACSPIYLLAAWFSDAGVLDVLRGLLLLAGLMFVSAGVSMLSYRRATLSIVQLAMAVWVLGLPCAWYVLAEFGFGDVSWLKTLSPLVQAWQLTGR